MTKTLQSIPRTTSHRSSAPMVVVVGLVALALGSAAIAIQGPLVSGVIRYHVSAGANNQIMGGDVAGLFLVAPTFAVAALLARRGSVAGPVLAIGPCFYAIYMYFQLAIGGDTFRYEGNSERFFPLFIALFVIAGAVAIWSWLAVGVEDLPQSSRMADRILGWFSFVMAGFLAVGLHLPGLMDAWLDTPTSNEYLADPFPFWLVKMMDLGIVVPVLVVVGAGLLRRSPWVQKAKYAVVGWVALLGSSVAGMAIVMQVNDDPGASSANTVAFSLFAVVGLGVAVSSYKPLLTRPTHAADPAGT